MELQIVVNNPGTPLAVSVSEFNEFGCSGCGGIFGITPISGAGTAQFNCGDCGQITLIVDDDLRRSTMGLGSSDKRTVFPEVVAHPRRGQSIDREQLIRDRKRDIMDDAGLELYTWLCYGYGRQVTFSRPATHTSKSRTLPILAVDEPTENVGVTWFGDNYHSHFLGLTLRRPLPAVLMFPISQVFGRFAMSGHVNAAVAPPVDFLSAYYGHEELERFGTDCGDGFTAALVIRYLRELSKLDIQRIMDVCFHRTCYGALREPDGNAIEHEDLFEALGLAVNGDPYDPAVTELPDDVFDEVIVDLFERIVQGQSAVRVKLAEGTLLTPLPIPDGSICVDLQETQLNDLVPADMQERPFKNQFGKYVVSYLPLTLLCGDQEAGARRHEAQAHSPTPVSGVYYLTRRLTRSFVFSTPNTLDAALTAFFLVKVLGPSIREMRQRAEATRK